MRDIQGTERIRPCPRCKEKAGREIARPLRAYADGSYYDKYEFIVVCTKCGWKTEAYGRGDQAKTAWNRAAVPDA